MEKEKEDQISIYKEEGILQKSGKGFHSASEFARKHLFYAVWSGRYLCNRRYSVTRDYLDFFSLIYVISGKMELVYGDQTITVSENEAFLIDFRKPHNYRAITDRLEKWEMIFNGNAAEAFYDLIVNQWGYVFKVKGLVKGVMDRIMEELGKPLTDDFELSLLLNNLFTYILKDHQLKMSESIKKALQYMYEYSYEPLQIQEIADYVGLSRSYFSRLFTKETGQTPYEYLLEVRINRAKQMLALDDVPVAYVAEQCGFVNTSHFNRVFKEKTGQTPSSFRNFFNMKL